MKKLLLAVVTALIAMIPVRVYAEDQGGFSLQVTPSPLIASIEPGVKKTLELRINNTGSQKESFVASLRSFSVNQDDGSIDLSNDTPKELSSFVTFETPKFSLEPGEWMTERVIIDTPKDAGFSYSFAISIDREDKASTLPSGATIKGSVAVFALLNVNRPDAKAQLALAEFSSARKVYEYLPSTLTLKVRNTGNTIIAPSGNVFIGRSANDTSPVATLALNDAGSYLVPGSVRPLSIQWNDGFPVRETVGGTTRSKWDFSKLSKLRIGKYTAKAILVYDDGQRDIPLEAEVSFWVFPWKIILAVLAVALLVITGMFTIFKKTRNMLPKKKTYSHNEDSRS